jgi:hypothetical protein
VKGWGAENSRPGSSLLKCRAGPDDDMSEYDKEGGLLESEAVATGIAVRMPLCHHISAFSSTQARAY